MALLNKKINRVSNIFLYEIDVGDSKKLIFLPKLSL